MKVTIAFLFIVFSSISYGVTVEEVLSKAQDLKRNTTRASYNCKYELFKGHSSNTAHTSYQGYFYKDDSQIYQKINNTEFVYADDFFLQISHNENAILLGKSRKEIQQEVDFTEILKNSKAKSIEEQQDAYVISIEYKAGVNSPYSLVKMRIAKSTYYFEQIDLYYRATKDFNTSMDQQDMEQPHLRISFSNMNVEALSNPKRFELSTYLQTNKNMLVPTGICSGYELIDNRIN